MSGVEIRQRAPSDGQKGGRRGQKGRPALYIGLAGALTMLTKENLCWLGYVANLGQGRYFVISQKKVVMYML